MVQREAKKKNCAINCWFNISIWTAELRTYTSPFPNFFKGLKLETSFSLKINTAIRLWYCTETTCKIEWFILKLLSINGVKFHQSDFFGEWFSPKISPWNLSESKQINYILAISNESRKESESYNFVRIISIWNKPARIRLPTTDRRPHSSTRC